jgi:hypothetical protein
MTTAFDGSEWKEKGGALVKAAGMAQISEETTRRETVVTKKKSLSEKEEEMFSEMTDEGACQRTALSIEVPVLGV